MYGLYTGSGGVKGETSPTCLRKYREEDEEEAVAKRAIKELEISFHKHFTIFSIYYYYYFIIIFHTFFYPRHLPTPTPTTHTHDLYPLPTTFSYTQQGLVTSDEKHLEYGILRNQAFEWERGRQ